ncbi:BIR protein [Plasmodium berghei]|uniref:BIR protein n=2 Tax=Plasmodium berghei TaxID=5821 RepID=A0A509AHH1_PLABA|nr:BIR protein [Plasmodium berghei ANKA]CXI14729.1 BIR protein [Plasmodium berghei]SBW38168.1 BIR protein [Plasmodium berghei]SCL82873.1 BIR protein [Plasmodium berghei]SCL83490.1 BIR protein [Plasmodium berghei]VUC54675.1 BIR protein [Plasmodium berghei ANKA]|eukprot:XP_034420501.1 BIR protein [Plasmodium berghei ANKA]
MNDHVCRRFLFVRSWFPDKLDKNKNYQFISDEHFKKYCTSNRCIGDLEKINAGCLYLFKELFGSFDLFKYHNNINIVDYIIIWLSYMLNLKEQAGNKSNLQYFYKTYINNDMYTNTIGGVEGYTSYKDLIDKKFYFLSMDKSIISKLYDAFKLLCNMYTEFDATNPTNKNYLDCAKKFVKKYQELNGNSNITGNSSYNKLLSTLSNDYDNFKKKCSGANCTNLPPLATIEEIKTSEQSSAYNPAHSSAQIPAHSSSQSSEQFSGHISEDPSSSSSIGNKLFTVLSIFGAIAFFLGISYKYSLFRFRKRAQKQYLREKIKNIKKRMNH